MGSEMCIRDSGYLAESLKDFNAGYFPDEYMGEGVRYEELLYNLRAIGDVTATHSLISSGRQKFSKEFTLQRYISDFGFKPDDRYRSWAAMLSTSKHVSSGEKHLPVSFFAYELSTDEPLCDFINAPQPALIKSVLELDGAETPYGKISLNHRKVGQFLDETFKLSLKDLGDWDKVLKAYAGLGEDVLMKSNMYKGRRLTNDLGM